MLERQPAFLSMQLAQITQEAKIIEGQIVNCKELSSDVESNKTRPRKLSKTGNTSTYRIKIQLFNRQWHLFSQQSQSGWDFGFRMFVTVPRSSSLVELVFADDVAALRDLFFSKRASPLTVVVERNGDCYASLLAVSRVPKLMFSC